MLFRVLNCTSKVRQKKSNLVDLTHSSLVKWVNISEPGRLARFFRCLISR